LSKLKKDLTTVLITNGNRVVQNVVDTDQRSEIEQSLLKHNKQDLTDLKFGV
jgi:hypothetical protein